MRFTHGAGAILRVAVRGKSAHVWPVVNGRGVSQMFVRAVWRLRRLIDVKQTLREMEVPTTRTGYGLSGPDFQKMTRSLFDR